MRIFLYIVVVLLFCFGYTICNIVYPEYLLNKGENAASWWGLRMNICSVLICLALLLICRKDDLKIGKFILGIGIGLSISDVIDRLKYDINKFTEIDSFMILITITIVYLEVYTEHSSSNLTKYIVKKCKSFKF